jgi:hypothetical protein
MTGAGKRAARRKPPGQAGRSWQPGCEFGEEILDEVTRFVEFLVVGSRLLAIGLGRDVGGLAGFSSGAMTRSSASKPLSAITCKNWCSTLRTVSDHRVHRPHQ